MDNLLLNHCCFWRGVYNLWVCNKGEKAERKYPTIFLPYAFPPKIEQLEKPIFIYKLSLVEGLGVRLNTCPCSSAHVVC